MFSSKRETGIEPATLSLARRCSTTEPLAHLLLFFASLCQRLCYNTTHFFICQHLFLIFSKKNMSCFLHDIFLTHVNLFSDYILYVSTFNISATLINNFLQISDNSDIQLSTINHIVKNTKGICDRHRLLIRPVR